jgi:integrase
MVKRATGVYLRTGTNVYQWRIRVPKDLAAFYPGKEWADRRTLGTSNLAQANRLAAQLYADWLTKFDQQRQQLNLQPTALTPELIKLMTDTFHYDALTADHNVRTQGSLTKDARLQGMPKELATELADFYKHRHAEYSRAMATSNIGLAFSTLKDEASKLGIAVDESTPGLEGALTEILKAMKEGVEAGIERNKGNAVPTPPAPTLQKPEKVYYLRDIFNLWKLADGLKRTPDSIRARERALELFEEFTHNTPIAKVKRLQGNDFKAWLQTRGEASKTIHDRLTYVKALLNYAYRDLELIPRHPWDGINIEHETETRRKPWTAVQISTFFAQPLYTSYALPRLQKGAGADASYWIPLLGLFSGARSSELCQLHCADIVQEQGVWVIDINDGAEGKTVKTKASRRQVPIHSELIRLGFLAYVEATRKAGHERLWPALSLREGRPSHTFSRWFNAKPRKAIPGVVIHDFHSLRHTVRTAMKVAKVSEQDQDLITGHEVQGSTGTKVYTHVDLVQLKEAVETIRYEGFDLPRSYKTA